MGNIVQTTIRLSSELKHELITFVYRVKAAGGRASIDSVTQEALRQYMRSNSPDTTVVPPARIEVSDNPPDPELAAWHEKLDAILESNDGAVVNAVTSMLLVLEKSAGRRRPKEKRKIMTPDEIIAMTDELLRRMNGPREKAG